MCSGSVSSSCSTSDTRRVTVERQEHHLIWKSYWTSQKYFKNILQASVVLIEKNIYFLQTLAASSWQLFSSTIYSWCKIVV
jgi:hypothetical protein